jgi:hypothetical protein
MQENSLESDSTPSMFMKFILTSSIIDWADLNEVESIIHQTIRSNSYYSHNDKFNLIWFGSIWFDSFYYLIWFNLIRFHAA